ncbi:MAG: hypothetical protein AAF489_11215 [Bacteroidota bacterium]
MKKIILLFSSIICIQCSDDRTIPPITQAENIQLQEFQELADPHKLFITDDEEPGEKLMLCLTFIDKASKKVLPNQRVSFYHTSAAGEYEPSNLNDQTTARLNGDAITDDSGNLYIESILPGNYGSSDDNRHIHTSVEGASPEAYDLFLKQHPEGIGSFFSSGNDQMFTTRLKKATNNVFVCFATIEVKNPKTKD